VPKYEVEFALFRTVEIEADSEVEANEKAAIIEDEEIESNTSKSEGYCIWNEARLKA